MITYQHTFARLDSFSRRIQRPNSLVCISGKVSAVTGSGITARGISEFVAVGDLVRIWSNMRFILAEVLSLNEGTAQVQLLDNTASIAMNAPVEVIGGFSIAPTSEWKGRVLNALAEPIDGLGPLNVGTDQRFLNETPPQSMERSQIGVAIHTGIKTIDIFTPICFGQRVGIFAGSGVGKSTLLSMLSRSSRFDTTVVALVGERGRETQEFVKQTLGDALRKSVVVVSTSDEAPARRKMVPLTATTIAEHFRDMGQNVLLVMDSVTRYAHALRELSLALGEPPVARGYPPSVFGKLPQLMERAGPGASGSGSITAIYTVLVDGDNHNEPIADTVRGILDGHIVLDRSIAAAGRYPAIDILGSVSRLADRAWKSDEARTAQELRRLVSRFEETRDLRALGGFQQGADPELDRAVAFVPRLYAALNQSHKESLCPDSFASVARATHI